MIFQEADTCFKKYILSRWPKWKPEEMAVSDWLASLMKFTEDDLAKAIFQYTQKHELYDKPKLPLLLTILGNVCRRYGKKQQIDAPCLFWLIRERDGAMKAMYGVTGREYTDEGIRRLAAAISKRYSPDFQGDCWNPLFSRDESENLGYPYGRFPIKGQEPVTATVPAPAEKKTVTQMTEDLFRPDKKIDDVKPATEYRANPEYDENYVPPDDEISF